MRLALIVAIIVILGLGGYITFNAVNKSKNTTEPPSASSSVEAPAPSTTPRATSIVKPTPVTSLNPALLTQTIIIKNLTFNPKVATVKVGTIVKWIDEGSAQHRILSEANIFYSNNLSQGGYYSFQFKSPGIYDYIDSVYPSMTGEIIVEK